MTISFGFQYSLECSYIPIPSRMFNFYAHGETLCPQGVSVTLFGVFPVLVPISCVLPFCSYNFTLSFVTIVYKSLILNLRLVSRTGHWTQSPVFLSSLLCVVVSCEGICCYATGSQSCLNYRGEGLIWPSQAFHASVHHFVCSERWRLKRWHLYL